MVGDTLAAIEQFPQRSCLLALNTTGLSWVRHTERPLPLPGLRLPEPDCASAHGVIRSQVDL